MGEGAGALVLESSAHAKGNAARESTPKWPGMRPPARPITWSFPAKTAKRSPRPCAWPWPTQGITPAKIDYINAHATSTTIGDAVETKALRQVFRTRADKIAINATKSLVGHTLGAAGAIGGIATVLAIHTGQIHPTANYEEPDPACALRGLSSSVQERKVKAALLNAFGFGSNNAAVVIKRYGA